MENEIIKTKEKKYKEFDPTESLLETLLNIYNIKNVQISDALECNPRTIAKFVNREYKNIPIEDAKKIATLLNVTIDFIIFNKQEYAIKLSPMNNIYIDYYDYLLLKIHGIIEDKIDYNEDWNHNKSINCIVHEISIENAFKYIYSTGMPYANTNLKEPLKKMDYLKFENLVLVKSKNKYYMLNYYKELYQHLLTIQYNEEYAKNILINLYLIDDIQAFMTKTKLKN